MKKDELKTTNIVELRKNLTDAQKELVKMRIDNSQRKLKNVKSIDLKKKEIARIKTFIRVKELTNAG